MLKTNSKKAKENLKNYIMKYSQSSFNDSKNFYKKDFGYNNSFKDRCTWLYKKFRDEKKNEEKAYNNNEFLMFDSWTAGLACNKLFLYRWFTRSAKNDLGAILEESEKQKNRFSEMDAINKLTFLIYREIINNMNK